MLRKLWLKPLEDRLVPATLTGSVFADYDGDAIRDTGEPGIAGATVRLDLNGNGTFDFSTSTKSDGSYSFANVVAGGAHKVTLIPPSGNTATKPLTVAVNVALIDIANIDYSLKPDGKIHGQFFNDLDFDGVIDAGETGLAGVSVTLDLYGNGKSILSAVSDSGGNYSFSGVPNGTHTLTAKIADYAHTSANPVGVNVTNALDIVANVGFNKSAILSGFVFSDTNGNGTLDGAERLLPNYTVGLDLGNNGTIDQTVTTNANGQYFFGGVANGTHSLALNETGISGTPTNKVVTVTGGVGATGLGFAVMPAGKLEGIAFNDTNANGVQDASEVGIAGVKVNLYLYGDFSNNRSVITTANGKYSFADVPDGSHVVSAGLSNFVNTTTQNMSVAFTKGVAQLPPQPALPTGPRTPGDPVALPVTFPNTFGFAASNVVSGFVYHDANKNGKADAGETELSGVTVRLDSSISVVTNKYGQYAFTGVAAGTHTVSVIPPTGYQGTTLSKTLTVVDSSMTGNGFALTVSDAIKVVAISKAAGNSVSVLTSTGTIKSSFTPFSGDGDTRIATGDVNGDTIEDYAVATGAGRVTLVRVLDGATGSELFAITPFGSQFYGGAFVSLGDLNNDGRADLVISPDITGGPRVRIFSGNGFTQIADFWGIDDVDFRGGARTAVGDLNNDKTGDLIVSAGFGGGPRVALFDGSQLTLTGGPKFIGDFFAFESSLTNGAYVAAGDINGDGFADLVVGAGFGGAPRITAFSGKDLINDVQTRLADFFAGGQIGDRTGVRVATADVDNDGKADIIASYRRIPTFATHVVAYPGKNLTQPLYDVEPYADYFGAIYVG